MNRIRLPNVAKRPPKTPHKREDRRQRRGVPSMPAQIELTLELPRGPLPSAADAPAKDKDEKAPDRGIAIVDFYI